MTQNQVNFDLIFNGLTLPAMILEPDGMHIVAASEGYLNATMRTADDIVGKYLFDAFPDDPDDGDVSGTTSLRQSIEEVIRTQKPHTMATVRYPIPRPPEQSGGFVERFWQVTNSPIFDSQGELQYVLNAPVDVTAQVRAEKTAEQAATLARLAGRFAKLGWWRYTVSPAQLYWSDETAAIHDEEPGFAPAVADAISFYKPDYRDAVAESFQACLEQGNPFDLVTELITAKGRELWVRSIGEAERDDAGKIIAVRGAFQDITDLVAARTLAAEVNQQLKETLEHISDAFFMLDPDWRFVFVNQQAEHLLQTAEENLLGHTLWDKFPEAVGSVFEQEYRRAVDENTTARFTEYYPPLGYWVEVNAYSTKDGLAVYFRDVTSHIEAEQNLRTSKERFELTTKATNDVIWDWDVAKNTIWWSTAYSEQFGHPRSEEGDDPDSWLDNIHPEDYQRITESFFAVFDRPDVSHWHGEYRLLRADGSAADIVDRCYIVRDTKGNAVRLIGSIRDVSEQKELDERLRQAQKMEAVGQLTGGVAHDFNNLLTVILGNAELIAEQLPAEHSLHALAEMTVNAAERGSELTNRLLAFARRQPLEPKPTQINALLDNMLPLLKRTLSESIKIDYLPSDDLWLSEVDASQLESAILNLAINARDAMSGSGRLTIETSNAELDDSYSEQHGEVSAGEYTLISISDTGSGMTAEVIRQAFEPFFTTKDRGKGSGLGLSMVYGFVKQSRGHIKIYSEVGHGSTVKLYLPRCRTATDSVSHDQPKPSQQGGSEHILVVEDDDLVRQHVVAQLEGLGYQVKAVSSGEAALKVLNESSFDLLFSDVVMPGEINGPKLVELAQQRFPELKVLFTSGYTENAIVHHGRLDPGVKLLSKPYRRQELAEKVRDVLES